MRRCLVSVDESEKAFLQRRQRYGRSPECVRMCVVTDELCEKRRSQMGQRNGFSPECVRTCAVRLAAWLKDLLQSSQRYGFSPECVRRWVLSVEGRAYVLPQMRQRFGRPESSGVDGDMSLVQLCSRPPPGAVPGRLRRPPPLLPSLEVGLGAGSGRGTPPPGLRLPSTGLKDVSDASEEDGAGAPGGGEIFLDSEVYQNFRVVSPTRDNGDYGQR
ncbi:hypothetical protein KUF71_005593 [Frankliniella fusca]|uniref:Uncharacterized protein n=1 Tax=Frankliniella fusca TaxID=407009 RepID=A0AAE1H4U4_9NEOP|nr:hypothetical protein KUF71_005593 [Frankliniella fusca]